MSLIKKIPTIFVKREDIKNDPKIQEIIHQIKEYTAKMEFDVGKRLSFSGTQIYPGTKSEFEDMVARGVKKIFDADEVRVKYNDETQLADISVIYKMDCRGPFIMEKSE